MGEKKIAEAYILGIPFGLFGAHHFYLGRKGFGILYACTLGLLGFGYIYDMIRMRWLVKHANKHGTKVKMLSDVYLIGALGGIFGAHHFYLGNKKLGIFYACTLGVFTMGWIADLFRIKYLVKDHNDHTEDKSLGTAYILALPPLGIFGIYHYYLGNVKLGLIYTFTCGIFGIGWIVDLFRMPRLLRKAGLDKKSIGTSYIMAMPPFGLFGAHHYYLGNYYLGIVYTCTLGIFTIGWIADLFRMKNLVKASNDPTNDYGTTRVSTYILCVSPLGLFGAHHFYMERYLNGGFYFATLGLFGFGWFFDMLRLPVLYERNADEDNHKYPDEAYIYWFPFGIFGLHHFYLENKKWGFLYACTLGCLGIGWLIDGIRLPVLIKEYNKCVEDPKLNNLRICITPKAKNEANSELRISSLGDFEVNREMFNNENYEYLDENIANECPVYTGQDSYITCTTSLVTPDHETTPTYEDSDGYHYIDNYPRDEIRHYDDVNVTVENELEQYEFQNQQNYDDRNPTEYNDNVQYTSDEIRQSRDYMNVL